MSFTYLQFIHASFTSIEVELESNEKKKWAETETEEEKRGGRRIKRKRKRRKGDKDKENREREEENDARTQFFHISLQLARVAKRGQGHWLPRNTAQTGTATTLG